MIFIFCFFTSKNLQAQRCDTLSFQSKYWFQDFRGAFITKLFATANGNIFIAGESAGPVERIRLDAGDANITKLTDRGTPLWSKNIGAYRSNERVNGVKQTTDGGFIIAGTTQMQNIYSDGWIARLDANGAIKWSFTFPAPSSTCSKIIQLSDGGFAAVGYVLLNFDGDELGNISTIYSSEALIVRLDKDGNKVWSRSFSTERLNDLNSIIQLHDGSLVATGETMDTAVIRNWAPFIIKIDNNTGQIIWSNHLDNISSTVQQPEEMPDHSIRVHIGNYINYFDANGKAVGNLKFNLPDSSFDGQYVVYMGSSSPGEDCYFAYRYRHPVLFKIKGDSAVLWARIYSYQSTPGSFGSAPDAIFANNAFYLGGEIDVDDFPGGPNYLPYLIKTDANGKTTCSDTFATPFIFTKLNIQNNSSVFFKDGLPPEPSSVGMYSQNILPHRILDCYDTTCCRDTVIYKNANICEGSYYTLPDGNTTNAAGIYPVAFKKPTGCDSVIYITASIEKNIKVSLGNDTCFSGNNAITYKLSFPVQVKYQWQDGNTDSIYTATQPGQYWVHATSSCNTSGDSVLIYKECDFPLYIPDAFTPNNDGLNDIFRVGDLKGQHLIDFSIYNRFAQRIFFTTDPYKGWDGMLNGIQQPKGTYVYIIRYVDLGDHTRELKGTVVLIR